MLLLPRYVVFMEGKGARGENDLLEWASKRNC